MQLTGINKFFPHEFNRKYSQYLPQLLLPVICRRFDWIEIFGGITSNEEDGDLSAET